MNFKLINSEQFTTILDRLTRFEPAKKRYERVFNDIISKNYLGDNKNNLSQKEKCQIATHIINNSLKTQDNNEKINILFRALEDKYFYSDEISYQYLSNRVNFSSLINETRINQKTPKNILWLKNILNKFQTFEDLELLRKKDKLGFPIEKIILCEGQTEYVLLESLFNLLGYNLDSEGILVLPAGGKNQVAKKYYEMIEYVKLPIFVLLDADAKETEALILPKLRGFDKIYLINNGEFEDLIPINILKNTLNYVHNSEYNCVYEDFVSQNSMVKNLELIYRKYGFGEFKKAQFALELKNYIESNCIKEDFCNSEINDILTALQQ